MTDTKDHRVDVAGIAPDKRATPREGVALKVIVNADGVPVAAFDGNGWLLYLHDGYRNVRTDLTWPSANGDVVEAVLRAVES